MRGSILRAVPVCAVVFACGCFLTGGRDATAPPADPPTSSPTAAYWSGAAAALDQKPAGQDFGSMVRLVRTQTEALRGLPADGVDADLVAAVTAVVKAEDEVLRRADMANNDPELLKAQPAMAKSLADANKAAADAKKRLRALQPVLQSRHGGGFAPMTG